MFIHLSWGHVRSHIKFGPDRFSRFVVYRLQTSNVYIDYRLLKSNMFAANFSFWFLYFYYITWNMMPSLKSKYLIWFFIFTCVGRKDDLESVLLTDVLQTALQGTQLSRHTAERLSTILDTRTRVSLSLLQVNIYIQCTGSLRLVYMKV